MKLVALFSSQSQLEKGGAMFRFFFILAALGLAAAPAAAASYSATLATPATGRFIARDIVWNCGVAACQGATEESRPVVICESLAKRAGQIESFLVNGNALSPADLQRCNASARPQPGETVASK